MERWPASCRSDLQLVCDRTAARPIRARARPSEFVEEFEGASVVDPPPAGLPATEVLHGEHRDVGVQTEATGKRPREEFHCLCETRAAPQSLATGHQRHPWWPWAAACPSCVAAILAASRTRYSL